MIGYIAVNEEKNEENKCFIIKLISFTSLTECQTISDDNEVIGDEETALKGIEKLKKFIKEIEFPTKLSVLNFKVKIDDKLIEKVADSANINPNSYKVMTHEEIYEILKECLDWIFNKF